MGTAWVVFPWTTWGFPVGDIPDGFMRVPGTASLMVEEAPPPPGDCPRCGYARHPDCDGTGTVEVARAFRECPYRAQRDLADRLGKKPAP